MVIAENVACDDSDRATARAILRHQASLATAHERASKEIPQYVHQLRAVTNWPGTVGVSAYDAALRFSDLVNSDIKMSAIHARLATANEYFQCLPDTTVDDPATAGKFLETIRRRVTVILKPDTIGFKSGATTYEVMPAALLAEMAREVTAKPESGRKRKQRR